MLVQRRRQTTQAGVTLFAAQFAVWLNQAYWLSMRFRFGLVEGGGLR
jgi:hypothetical protein